MIPERFYPTVTSNNGLELTGALSTLLTTDETLGDPYMMGYLTDDKAEGLHLRRIEYNQDDDIISIKRMHGNLPWGYMAWLSNYFNSYGFPYSAIAKSGDNNWGNTGYLNNDGIRYFSFINSGKIVSFETTNNYSTSTDDAAFFCIFSIYRDDNGYLRCRNFTTGQLIRTTSTSNYFVTKKDIYDFVKSGKSLYFRTNLLSSDSSYEEIELKYEQYNGRYFEIGNTSAGEEVILFITTVYYSNNARFSWDGQTANPSTNNTFTPFYKIGFNYKDMYRNILWNNKGISANNYIRWTVSGDTTNVVFAPFTPTLLDGGYAPSAFPDMEFTLDLLKYVQSSGNRADPFLNEDKTAVFLYSGNNYDNIMSCINMESVVNAISLYNKVTLTWNQSTNSMTYSTNNYVNLFNENNTPESRILSSSYALIEPFLREWQKTDADITENDFNVDTDLPDDSGGGGLPGDDTPVNPPSVEGDSITLQLNRRLSIPTEFITLYNLTSEQLALFGRTLWKSINDYDPVTQSGLDNLMNWFSTLSEEVTGTLDISAILNFVINCRIYPFSVGTLDISTSTGTNNIYFGTGKAPFGVGSTTRVLTSTTTIIDCGSVLCKPGSPYNDFRDYYNTNVTCFLPYCGTVELNPIEVLNNYVHVYYSIDFYSGECTAIVYVETTGGVNYIAGVSNGTIGVLLPLTATNAGQLSSRHTVDNARSSNLLYNVFGSMFSGVASAAGGNYSGIGNALGNLATLNNQNRILEAQKEGRSSVMAPSLSGGTGAASFALPANPYIQIRRGTYAYAPSSSDTKISYDMYSKTIGYTSSTEGRLSDFTGLTMCDNPNVSGINATEEEKQYIKMYLESGVIV